MKGTRDAYVSDPYKFFFSFYFTNNYLQLRTTLVRRQPMYETTEMAWDGRRQRQGLETPLVFFYIHIVTLLYAKNYNIYISTPYKSRGLGQAKPGPSRVWRLWLGLGFEKAKAGSGQAKARAFRPSRARQITSGGTPFVSSLTSYPLRRRCE
jgi:hypothetical protein